jgi:hypothetical protein
MMTANNQQRIGSGFTRAAAFALLAVAAALFPAGEARAQWTTTGTTTSTTNNVGVGTATPTSKLVVNGNAAATTAAPQDGTVFQVIGGDALKTRISVDSFGSISGPSITFRHARGTGAAPTAAQLGDALGIVYGTGFGATGFLTAPKPAMWMVATENWTDAAAGSAIFFNTVKNGTTATVERMRINNDGAVGIGTATPGMLNGVNFAAYVPLHVQGLAGAMANVVVDSALPTSGYVINDSSQAVDGRIWSMTQAAGGGKLTFSTYADAGTRTDRVVIDRTGNMGVGTLAPTSRLHVAGDITVDGNINAKYQDVAEWVPSTQKLNAGTVVILDVEHNNHVAASATAYDTRVAGVVSARPGISLGERGEGKVLVATTGRVKVRVDASKGAIKVGDLLVTSETAGVAMRSQPLELGGVPIHRPGTLIGKALESLEKGTGEILVLLSLQ